MSKIDKIRNKLSSIQKDREDFEKQKKVLEAEMNIGRSNMSKIQKRLKKDALDGNETLQLDTSTPQFISDNAVAALSPQSGPQQKKLSKIMKHGSFSNQSFQNLLASNQSNNSQPNQSSASTSSNIFFEAVAQKNIPGIITMASQILPTGTRISDWAYTGELNSTPTVVKSKELYEVSRLLGRGSFGEVLLGKNIEDNKMYALKNIFCSKDREFEAVCREIKYLRINRHPFVVDILDVFMTVSPRVVSIVMHYCESGTLSSVINSAKKNKSSLPEVQIIKWSIQLALAINYMHCNHILHRDLKPMNIMLTEGGDLLKLADFGLAISLDDEDIDQNEEAGTPYYTAPEMIKRESYSYPSDCWSFGIILFQLLTLDRPFEGNNTADLVKSILTDDVPALPAHYSDEIKQISVDLLKKDPSERLTMAQLLCSGLIYPRLLNFPSTYRPKYLEERIRRSHIKQLEQQVEFLAKPHRNTILNKNNLPLNLNKNNIHSNSNIQEDSSSVNSSRSLTDSVNGSGDSNNSNNNNNNEKLEIDVAVKNMEALSDPNSPIKTPLSPENVKGGRKGLELVKAKVNDNEISTNIESVNDEIKKKLFEDENQTENETETDNEVNNNSENNSEVQNLVIPSNSEVPSSIIEEKIAEGGIEEGIEEGIDENED